MSYSDYGSYNWKKENGSWIFKSEFEDTSLISQITGDPVSKETTEFIGIPLKLKAVKATMDMEEQYPELAFEITGTHHSVIGDLKNYAVVSYKGHPVVMKAGNKIDEIDYNDVEDEEYVGTKSVKKKNFVQKTIDIVDGNCRIKVCIDKSFNFWSMAYVKNNDDEYLSICGYGLGEHWWLNEHGNQTNWEDDISEERIPIEHWPREKECLEKTLKLLKI